MKILVPISKVPDTTAKIDFSDNNSTFNTENVQFIMNPTDEWYALVRAIELKEEKGGTVTVINVGPSENDQIIRKALAIGADNAVRVDAEPTDGFFVAKQIAEHAQAENYDLILTGKETIDYNGFQIGGMIAELLDMSYVGLVTKLAVEENALVLHREIEGGEELLEAALPCVVGAQKGMAEQRIPNMRGIMQARTKPLNVVPATEAETRTEIVQYEKPAQRESATMVDPDNMDELVRLLHEEAKVI